MSMDPMQFVRAMQEKARIEADAPTEMSPDIRPMSDKRLPTSMGDAALADLVVRPGSPAYNRNIPPPDPWTGGLPLVSQTVQEVPMGSPTNETVAFAQSVGQRVGVYCGRGENFILAVEQAPDWEPSYSKSIDGPTLLQILEVATALSVKVVDKTGGELAVLRLETAHESQETSSRSHSQPADSGARTGSARKRKDAPAGVSRPRAGRDTPTPLSANWASGTG